MDTNTNHSLVPFALCPTVYNIHNLWKDDNVARRIYNAFECERQENMVWHSTPNKRPSILYIIHTISHRKLMAAGISWLLCAGLIYAKREQKKPLMDIYGFIKPNAAGFNGSLTEYRVSIKKKWRQATHHQGVWWNKGNMTHATGEKESKTLSPPSRRVDKQ